VCYPTGQRARRCARIGESAVDDEARVRLRQASLLRPSLKQPKPISPMIGRQLNLRLVRRRQFRPVRATLRSQGWELDRGLAYLLIPDHN